MVTMKRNDGVIVEIDEDRIEYYLFKKQWKIIDGQSTKYSGTEWQNLDEWQNGAPKTFIAAVDNVSDAFKGLKGVLWLSDTKEHAQEYKPNLVVVNIPDKRKLYPNPYYHPVPQKDFYRYVLYEGEISAKDIKSFEMEEYVEQYKKETLVFDFDKANLVYEPSQKHDITMIPAVKVFADSDKSTYIYISIWGGCNISVQFAIPFTGMRKGTWVFTSISKDIGCHDYDNWEKIIESSSSKYIGWRVPSNIEKIYEFYDDVPSMIHDQSFKEKLEDAFLGSQHRNVDVIIKGSLRINYLEKMVKGFLEFSKWKDMLRD